MTDPLRPRNPHKENARRLAARLKSYAEQVLIDLAHDRPTPAHGKQAADIVVDLLVELQLYAGDAAKARRAA
jgi:hypothetical protein